MRPKSAVLMETMYMLSTYKSVKGWSVPLLYINNHWIHYNIVNCFGTMIDYMYMLCQVYHCSLRKLIQDNVKDSWSESVTTYSHRQEYVQMPLCTYSPIIILQQMWQSRPFLDVAHCWHISRYRAGADTGPVYLRIYTWNIVWMNAKIDGCIW